MKTLQREDLENFGSIITLKGTNTCLGYLLIFDKENDPEKKAEEAWGCYCASHGRVPVTREEATTHNTVFDTAIVKGLDESCKVGQGGYFYVKELPMLCVVTWKGTVVAEGADVQKKKSCVEFVRNGRRYRSRGTKGEAALFIRVQ